MIQASAILCLLVTGAIEVEVSPPLQAESPPIQYVTTLLHTAGGSLGISQPVRLCLRDSVASQPSLAESVANQAEAFALCPQPDGATVVVGADVRGVLYGAVWLADRLRVDGADALKRTDKRVPLFGIRNRVDAGARQAAPGRGPESCLEVDLRYTCNMRVVDGAASYTFLDAVEPRLVADVAAHHQQVEAQRERFREELDRIAAWELMPFLSCAPFVDMPDLEHLIAVYKDAISEDGLALSAALDAPWDVWQAMYRQSLEAFPQLGGLRAALQDWPQRYQVAALRGPQAEALGMIGAWRRFVEKAQQVVVQEAGKTCIISSWGNPPDTFPFNRPAEIRAIFAGVPLDGLVLQNNHCEHDFYLISPFNDNFGVGEIPKGIMFQVQREYEGQGIVPVYVGPRIAEDFAHCVRLGETETAEARMWWSRNFFEPLCWTRWNLYAWSRACWEPEGDPWEWARDYNRIEFGPGGAELLADALMMTQELAKRTFYMPGFSGAKRDAYAITHRLCFTDGRHYYRVIRDPHEAGYRENHLRGKVPLLMAQAEATRELSEAMLAKAQTAAAAMTAVEQARPVLDSFAHLDDLVHLLTHYQQALMLWYYKDEPGLPVPVADEARAQCATNARRALDLYAAYRQLWGLYKDAGMVPLLRRYLKQLGAELPPEIEPPVTFTLPCTAAALTVDGVLEDAWPGPVIELDNGDPQHPYAAVLRLAAGADALYAAVRLVDQHITPIRVGRVYDSDAVSLTFDTDADGREDANYYLLMDAETREGVLLTVMRQMLLGSHDYEDRARAVPNDPGTSVVFRQTEDGGLWECALPWSMLDGFSPAGSVPLGINVVLHDAGGPASAKNRLEYPPVPTWRAAPPPVFAYTIPQGVRTMKRDEERLETDDEQTR